MFQWRVVAETDARGGVEPEAKGVVSDGFTERAQFDDFGTAIPMPLFGLKEPLGDSQFGDVGLQAAVLLDGVPKRDDFDAISGRQRSPLAAVGDKVFPRKVGEIGEPLIGRGRFLVPAGSGNQGTAFLGGGAYSRGCGRASFGASRRRASASAFEWSS